MLIVLSVMGLTAAVVLSQIGTRDDLKVAAAARQLMADLAYAQSRAITFQSRQYVNFTGDQYTLATREGTWFVPLTHPVSRGDYVGQFEGGVRIESADFDQQGCLAFDALGQPLSYSTSVNVSAGLTNPGLVKIRCGSAEVTLRIEPYTGEMSAVASSLTSAGQ